MDSVQSIQWRHGGKGKCHFCGTESNHRARFMTADRRAGLFFCRECAHRVRQDADGFFKRAVKALAGL